MDLSTWLADIEKNADDAVMRMELSCILKGTRIGILTSGATTSRSAPPVNPLDLPKRGEWSNISGDFPQYVTFESSSFEKVLKDYYARFGKKTILNQTRQNDDTIISFTDNTRVSITERFRGAKSGGWAAGTTYYILYAPMDTGDEFTTSLTWRKGMFRLWEPLEYFERGTRP